MKQHVLNTMQYLTILKDDNFKHFTKTGHTYMVVAEQCGWSCLGDLTWPFVLGRFPNLCFLKSRMD